MRGSSSAVSRRQIASDAAFRQHDQSRAERQGEVHVMGDRHARGAAIGLVAQHVETMQLLIDVEERRRLVEQQQPRALRETRGKQNALALAAAERRQRYAGGTPGSRTAASPLRRSGGPRPIRTIASHAA